MHQTFDTREAWLNAFASETRPHFERAGFPLPENVRVSIGFTSGGKRGKSVGECWGTSSSDDGHFEIFLRPSLDRDARVADVLTHELAHAAVGLEAKHGKTFKRCVTALGLTGKPTATVAGEGWHAWAKPVLAKLGPMPGSRLSEAHSLAKKQSTRMLKCVCQDCGFTFRTTRKHLDQHGGELSCPARDCDGEVECV